jgi:hypothetical protein
MRLPHRLAIIFWTALFAAARNVAGSVERREDRIQKQGPTEMATTESAQRKKLIKCIKEWREKRNIGKRELSRLMDRTEMWARRVEAGQVKRIDVIEFLKLAEICRFNPGAAINLIRRGRDC